MSEKISMYKPSNHPFLCWDKCSAGIGCTDQLLHVFEKWVLLLCSQTREDNIADDAWKRNSSKESFYPKPLTVHLLQGQFP